MAAQPPDILYDPPLIRFRIDGRIAAERPLADLRRVIDFDFGETLYSNEGSFTLLDFTDTFWIVSDDVGLPTHQEWAALLQQIAATSKRESSGTQNVGAPAASSASSKAPVPVSPPPNPSPLPTFRGSFGVLSTLRFAGSRSCNPA